MELNVWVCDLGSYNEGNAIGEWFSFPLNRESVCETLRGLAESAGVTVRLEELVIHDCDCSIYGVKIDEYESFEKVNELGKMLVELEDSFGNKLLEDILTEVCSDIETIYDEKDNIVVYPDYTLEDVAEELVKDHCFGHIPNNILPYIDFDAIARDLSYDGFYELEHGVVEWH